MKTYPIRENMSIFYSWISSLTREKTSKSTSKIETVRGIFRKTSLQFIPLKKTRKVQKCVFKLYFDLQKKKHRQSIQLFPRKTKSQP